MRAYVRTVAVVYRTYISHVPVQKEVDKTIRLSRCLYPATNRRLPVPGHADTLEAGPARADNNAGIRRIFVSTFFLQLSLSLTSRNKSLPLSKCSFRHRKRIMDISYSTTRGVHP